MIFKCAFLALQRLFCSQYRSMAWKSIGLTLGILAALWFLMRQVFLYSIWPMVEPYVPSFLHWGGWLAITGIIIFSIGLALLLALLIAPITAMIGGFFMDDAAEVIEKQDFPSDPPGQAMSLNRSLVIASRFLLLSLIGNFIALVIYFIPGVNLIGFYVINGYLLGREYFEFAAGRHLGETKAHLFYKANSLTVFSAGVLVAIFISIPLLNLLTPLFAAAFMTYLYKTLKQPHLDL